MHITQVELENIKSHAESKFQFARGTTAITGENGAGKTTLIEAVAWTLFDVLDYKKDDFVRRGAKKGSVRVTFESGLDEREYVVYRDTGTGYYVYDPALKLRVADKKEEVTRFLWQHLGLEPGTDLESLFKHAIGVPQGTFTAVFLATAAERKRTFDTLLKVEEYRRGADELLKTQRFVESQIAAIRERIARNEGELNRAETIGSDQQRMAAEVATLDRELNSIGESIGEKAQLLNILDEKSDRRAKAKAEAESARSAAERSEIVLRQRESELRQSKDAAENISSVTADAERYTEAVGRIKELERERGERDRLRNELSKIEAAEISIKAEEKHVRQALRSLQDSRNEAETLRPLAIEQETREKEVESIRVSLARIEAAETQVAGLDRKLETLREAFLQNKDSLKAAAMKAKGAEQVAELEAKEADTLAVIARLRAGLERDEKFQSEIRNGLCPILSEKCLNLKEGQTLDGFLSTKFEDIKAEVRSLEAERGTIAVALSASREAERSLALMAALEERKLEIEAEGKRLRDERESLAAETDGKTDLIQALGLAQGSLRELDNPTARIAMIEKELLREPELREAITNVERNLERLENDRRLIAEQLEDHQNFDARWQETTKIRDSTAEAHRRFLTFEGPAGLLGERETKFEAARSEFTKLKERLDKAESELELAERDYDNDQHLSVRSALGELQQRQTATRVRLEAARSRERELAEEVERLARIRMDLQEEMREKQRSEKVAETAVFIRDTLKDAAPLVARNYVYHVSAEANQMYREITGNGERTLKWAEDYGIILEEGGYERPFQSLSGGEQMAAALSVRLALLKQISDIRIAFFDEPTTNMDAERRENLAQQIGQIKHFDQLFVISHDDTFEGYMDHEIRVGD
jgi:DNA repair protein SbcC/Rad50